MAQKLVTVVVHGVAAVAEDCRIDKAKLARRGDMRPWIVKNGIGPCGDGGERADAESQREHSGDGEARRTTQLTEGKLQVLQQMLQLEPTPALPRHICNQRHIAEFTLRIPARIGW